MLADEILIPKRRGLPWQQIAIMILAVLAIGAGVVYWRTVHSSTPAQRYLTAPVQHTDLAQTIAATGPIIAPSAVPLNFKNSGKVAEIDVKVGDTVTAGQVLAK